MQRQTIPQPEPCGSGSSLYTREPAMRKNGMRRCGGYAWNQGRKNAAARSQRAWRGSPCMVENGMRRRGGGETLRNVPQSPSEPPPRFVRGGACKGAQRAEEADFAAEERSCRKNIRSIRASGYSQSFRRPSGAAPFARRVGRSAHVSSYVSRNGGVRLPAR